MIDSLAPVPHEAARPGTPVQPAELSRWLATPRSAMATWEDRTRFRWELEQMSRANPHLIDDFGLTRRQVEAEIAKPFWQA
jgi:uncharacterized protein YjiS (DUF1127 family)